MGKRKKVDLEKIRGVSEDRRRQGTGLPELCQGSLQERRPRQPGTPVRTSGDGHSDASPVKDSRTEGLLLTFFHKVSLLRTHRFPAPQRARRPPRLGSSPNNWHHRPPHGWEGTLVRPMLRGTAYPGEATSRLPRGFNLRIALKGEGPPWPSHPPSSRAGAPRSPLNPLPREERHSGRELRRLVDRQTQVPGHMRREKVGSDPPRPPLEHGRFRTAPPGTHERRERGSRRSGSGGTGPRRCQRRTVRAEPLSPRLETEVDRRLGDPRRGRAPEPYADSGEERGNRLVEAEEGEEGGRRTTTEGGASPWSG